MHDLPKIAQDAPKPGRDLPSPGGAPDNRFYPLATRGETQPFLFRERQNMKNSHIEWCDHTFNPWIGCTKVSPGCKNCYALTLNKRWKQGRNWGKGAPRERTSSAYWREPLKWNRDASRFPYKCVNCAAHYRDPDSLGSPWKCECGGYVSFYRPRVFCASMADWLDDEVPIVWLADLLALIHDTPNLDWLLLTKRPENFKDRLICVGSYWSLCGRGSPQDPGTIIEWLEGTKIPDNVWIGTSVEDQHLANKRIPQLLEIPAKVRFLSCEPLLGPIKFSDVTKRIDAFSWLGKRALFGIHWVIVGGESGPGARPMHPEWARSLRDQCVAAGVPFFFKQWGEWAPYDRGGIDSRLLARPGSLDEPLGKFGKKLSGRLLDGSEYSQFPT